MDTTFGRRKSQTSSGQTKGATNPPDAASTVQDVSKPINLNKLNLVTVDADVEVTFDEEVVDGLYILVFACVRCANDGTDTDGVLVYQIDTFLGINDPSLFSAEYIL
jgi:hypothetical protein